MGAFLLVVGLFIAGLTTLQNNADNLRAGLISACQHNGNPLRAVVRNGVRLDEAKLHKQVHQTRHADFSKFFPNLTPQRLALLKIRQVKQLRKQIAQDKAELGHLAPVDCRSLY